MSCDEQDLRELDKTAEKCLCRDNCEYKNGPSCPGTPMCCAHNTEEYYPGHPKP